MIFCRSFTAAVPAAPEPAGLLVTWVRGLPTDLTIDTFCITLLIMFLSLVIDARLTGTSVECMTDGAGSILVLRSSSPTTAVSSGTAIGSTS